MSGRQQHKPDLAPDCPGIRGCRANQSATRLQDGPTMRTRSRHYPFSPTRHIVPTIHPSVRQLECLQRG